MIAIEFRLKLSSMYSIRVPYSYQCARTYPVPAPSTIKGLCANALWRHNDGDPIKILEAIQNASYGASTRTAHPIAISSCTVRMVPMNALLRQFAFTPFIDCLISLTDGSDELGYGIAEALKVSPVYLGDSESLACIIPESICIISDMKEVGSGQEISVNSLFKFDFVTRGSASEKGVVLYMQDNPIAVDAVLERYIAPITQEGESFKPLDTISFISSQKGIYVEGKRVRSIFSMDVPERKSQNVAVSKRKNLIK